MQDSRFPKKVRQFIFCLSYIFFLFIFMNLLLSVVFFFRDSIKIKQQKYARHSNYVNTKLFEENGAPINNGMRSGYQLKWVDFTAYEGFDKAYVSDVLDDFFQLNRKGFSYQPWVGFSQPIFNSKTINIQPDKFGIPIRRTSNPAGEEKETIQIFVFGGSTTFGYNVSDEHTWPSFLSKILNKRLIDNNSEKQIEVINYGRGYFNPSQEVVLLIDLLRRGHKPDFVIFMDGVNGPGSCIPKYTKKTAEAVNLIQHGKIPGNIFDKYGFIPMIRFARTMRMRLEQNVFKRKLAIPTQEHQKSTKTAEMAINEKCEMYKYNIELAEKVSDLNGCKVFFFLQPTPLVNYNLQLYRSGIDTAGFSNRREDAVLANNAYTDNCTQIIDLSHLFRKWGNNKKAIVDNCHYSPGFNEFIALHVAAYIQIDSINEE